MEFEKISRYTLVGEFLEMITDYLSIGMPTEEFIKFFYEATGANIVLDERLSVIRNREIYDIQKSENGYSSTYMCPELANAIENRLRKEIIVKTRGTKIKSLR